MLFYIKERCFSKAGAKVLLFFDMTKFFRKKMQKKCKKAQNTCIIQKKAVILHAFFADLCRGRARSRDRMTAGFQKTIIN